MTAEERIAALEQRLLRVEDELAIGRLMASYGPLVDAGDADAVAGLWAEDGEYDVEGRICAAGPRLPRWCDHLHTKG
jgi:SnoaL-like domain